MRRGFFLLSMGEGLFKLAGRDWRTFYSFINWFYTGEPSTHVKWYIKILFIFENEYINQFYTYSNYFIIYTKESISQKSCKIFMSIIFSQQKDF